MKIYYHGHSCFSLITSNFRLLIDPWIKENPSSDLDHETVDCDYILVSHGHFDHLGDAVEIAKRTDATIIGVVELASYCEKQGVKTHGMQIGGEYQFPFGRIYLTPALHGSAIIEENTYLGLACGFVIENNGTSVYHAGDTGIFSEMQILGNRFSLDLAILPIGDNFTMGPKDALLATQLLKPKLVVPMHYNTFELIRQDPIAFKDALESHTSAQCVIMSVGDLLEI
ncbi:MAG: metal-dependent hydrolase [Bacillota bacterium]